MLNTWVHTKLQYPGIFSSVAAVLLHGILFMSPCLFALVDKISQHSRCRLMFVHRVYSLSAFVPAQLISLGTHNIHVCSLVSTSTNVPFKCLWKNKPLDTHGCIPNVEIQVLVLAGNSTSLCYVFCLTTVLFSCNRWWQNGRTPLYLKGLPASLYTY